MLIGIDVGQDHSVNNAACEAAGLQLVPADFNFDNLGSGMLTLLSLFALNHWAAEMWNAIDEAGENEQYGIAAVFVGFVFFGNVLVTSLCAVSGIQTRTTVIT